MFGSLIVFLLRLFYRPKLMLESLDEALSSNGRVLLTPHFASYIDPILFALFIPHKALLLVTPSMTRHWLWKHLAGRIRHAVVDYSNAFALKEIGELWKGNNCLILFPEPEPTTNGILMKLHETAVAIAEMSEAVIVPARACNTEHTHFSRMTGRLNGFLPRKLFIPVTLLSTGGERPSEVTGGARARRHAVRLQLERLMQDAMMQGAWHRCTLFNSFLRTRKLWGGSWTAAIESDGTRVSWNQLITKVCVLRRVIERLTEPGERVGIMLPNSTANLSLIVGIQLAGRTPAMINYSMGPRSIASACSLANVSRILTSSRFVEEGKFQPLVLALQGRGITVEYIEPLVSALSTSEKFSSLLVSRFPAPTPPAEQEDEAKKIAVILFTSGSEGVPKAVALSHLNLQANIAQVRMTLDFTARDVLLDIMPMFHSFGLCTGALMPLNAGMPVAFYPTPLHYKKIPQFAYSVKATIILGTNAFLAGYAKSAEQMDFFELRYCICGGDKLQPATAKLWYERFGIELLEGYGVTEASPVVGVNTRGRNRFGSIGRPLPATRTHLSPVEGVQEGGRLVVQGPNIMMGYIQENGDILPPPASGYDTGDIVTIDGDGYIFIKGRAKRFAKIGGEMISLAQVEDAVREIWPDFAHAVVSIEDEVRGEMIVLLTEKTACEREVLMREMIASGLPELAVPRRIIEVEALPKIGVGKTDYTAAAALAAEG